MAFSRKLRFPVSFAFSLDFFLPTLLASFLLIFISWKTWGNKNHNLTATPAPWQFRGPADGKDQELIIIEPPYNKVLLCVLRTRKKGSLTYRTYQRVGNTWLPHLSVGVYKRRWVVKEVRIRAFILLIKYFTWRGNYRKEKHKNDQNDPVVTLGEGWWQEIVTLYRKPGEHKSGGLLS